MTLLPPKPAPAQAFKLEMLPPGQLGVVVTYLEMLERPVSAQPVRSALKLVRWDPVDRDRYRALFREVGAPWLWSSRLLLTDAELDKTLTGPAVAVHAVTRRDATPVGLLELDFSVAGETQISYFGLVTGMTGRGHGKWLMAHALKLAWQEGTTRVWLHTDTNDHPGALRFYQGQGFKPYARAVETFPDPRLTGLYPADIAPHILLLP